MRTRKEWNRRWRGDLASLPEGQRDAPEPQVTFRDLTRKEIEAVLARHHVGRMAFSFQGRVDIEPIHYVFADGALYGRTTHGTKLTTLKHQPWVAFEVDEVDGPFDWRSVVIKGTVYFPLPDEASHPADAYDHAVAVIRTVVPQAFTPDDPLPGRNILFRLHVHEMTGRCASTDKAGETPHLLRHER